MTVAAAAIIVAIEARPKFGAKPGLGGSEATYVELVPRATQIGPSTKYPVDYCTYPRLRGFSECGRRLACANLQYLLRVRHSTMQHTQASFVHYRYVPFE